MVMGTARDELIDLIKTLPEDEVEDLLADARQRAEKTQRLSTTEWLEKVKRVSAAMEAKYGMMPSIVDTINEAREERLNDIMDSLRFGDPDSERSE
jgi:hypothetical protein